MNISSHPGFFFPLLNVDMTLVCNKTNKILDMDEDESDLYINFDMNMFSTSHINFLFFVPTKKIKKQ